MRPSLQQQYIAFQTICGTRERCLVGLALFDSAVSVDSKIAMVAALERPGCDEPLRTVKVNVKQVPL